jgi:diguanylate cyclase (GGDEF)-like protein
MILDLDNYMKSLVKTADELLATKEKATVMSELATKDSLTGIRNRLAYDNEAKKLDWEISNGNNDFGIAVIDLNYLKRINDKYGHERGNQAIRNLCFMTCNIFSHSPVFRIGGDEFAVILKNSDLDNIDSLIDEFNGTIVRNQSLSSDEPWETISAAIGYATFDPNSDTTADDVFKRADSAMYARKTGMKAARME